ncbi:MAG: RNA polymerase sigma factor [Acidimicrobiales bacterium]
MPSRVRAHDLSDEVFATVLARACGGDGSAWEILYRWLAPAVAGYLRVQGARDVDDVTSEVFLALVRNVERFRGGPAQFRSFTFVIAHRRLQDERRARYRADARSSSEPIDDQTHGGHETPGSDAADAADAALAALGADRVVARCNRLVPDQRDVVLLRIIGDLSVDEVAEALGKTSGAVKQLQRRAFENLRKEISSEAVPR